MDKEYISIKKNEIEKLYQIEDINGTILKSNLTYSDAIRDMDLCGWNGYIMKLMN